mgnify:FL=1
MGEGASPAGDDDALLRRELRRGAIPVEVRLAADEVADVSPPPPLFALVPRSAYLPIWHDGPVGDDASAGEDDAVDGPTPRTHFAPRLAPGRDASAPWFDHEGLPLRWNLPVGILRDLCTTAANGAPWKLTVHYRAFDDATDSVENADGAMFSCGVGGEPRDVARAHFFNSLKEAVFVAKGSASGVQGLSRRARADLWRSVVTGDGALAVAAEDELGMRATAAFKRVPMRLYVRRGGRNATGERGDGGAMRGWGELTTTSAPATVGATLREALEELGARGAHRATVEGVDVDLATTLVTLHGAMRGSDQFLHVCVWM